MSVSSLLSRVTMNGGSMMDEHNNGGGGDGSSAYHHMHRDFANLSMSFGDRGSCINSGNSNMFLHDSDHPNIHSSSSIQQENLYGNNVVTPHHPHASVTGDNISNCASNPGSHLLDPSFEDQFPGNAMRKSANMTETVAVPSSEHVAEIVGRQGCKIKSLRTQTNTYIKTPVKGAEPVFVVTGRMEDVAKARQQILSAAEHFSSIRATRRNGVSGPPGNTNSGTGSPTSVPGHITSQVRVPYKVVGLVVGPKGATIKRIQQTTSTYIVTPGKDKEPIFEVTGLLENIEKAKEEIEKHIASRTGTDNNSDLQIDDFQVNGIEASYRDQTADATCGKTSSGSNLHYDNNVVNRHDNLPPLSSISGNIRGPSAPLYQPLKTSHQMNQHPVNAVAASMKISELNGVSQSFNQFNQTNGFKPTNTDYDIDEGFVTSGSAASIYDPSVLWNDSSAYGVQRSNSVSMSATRILPPGEDGPHPRTRRTNSDPLAAAFQKIDAAFSSSSQSNSQGSTSPVTGRPNTFSRDRCKVCHVKEAEAGIGCGHTNFSLNCAQDIRQREYARKKCSTCKQVPNGPLVMRSSN